MPHQTPGEVDSSPYDASAAVQASVRQRNAEHPAESGDASSQEVNDPSALLPAGDLKLAPGMVALCKHLLDERVIRSKPRRQDRKDLSVELLGLGIPSRRG